MNYAEYLRRQQKVRSQTIGFQNGQDASQVTLKNQALANSIKTPVAVQTSFSKIGGTVANVLEATQQTCSPTSQTCSSGYSGVSQGFQTTDPTASLIGAAQRAALQCCSTNTSANPYSVTIPCGIVLSTISNAPGNITCCSKDGSQLFRNNSELVATQGKQEDLRRAFNLPSKLQGLRGPVVTGR